MTALNSAGCDVESAITSTIGGAVLSACQGSGTAAACGAAFQTSLGNVNLCAAGIPAASLSKDAKWTKVGDVTAGDLSQGKGKAKLSTMGVVGAIACPIAVNTIMGYLTSQIPLACGCTVSLTASQADQAIVAACEAAVPI